MINTFGDWNIAIEIFHNGTFLNNPMLDLYLRSVCELSTAGLSQEGLYNLHLYIEVRYQDTAVAIRRYLEAIEVIKIKMTPIPRYGNTCDDIYFLDIASHSPNSHYCVIFFGDNSFKNCLQ